jgi:hypothetical protein
MPSQRIEVHRQTAVQQWIGRLAIGWASGGIFLAVCVVPNIENTKFQRWVLPLAVVCFGAPTLAIVASRFCVDRVADFNDGYNQALQDVSQPITQNDAIQLQVSTPSLVAQSPAMGQSGVDLRSVPQILDLPSDRDDLSFLNAQIN